MTISKDDANKAMQSIATRSKVWVCTKDFDVSGKPVKCGQLLTVSYHSKAYKDEEQPGLYCYIPSEKSAFWLKDDFDFTQFENYFETTDTLQSSYSTYKSEISKYDEIFDSGFKKLKVRSVLILMGVPLAMLLLTIVFGSIWQPLGTILLAIMALSFILPAAVVATPMFGCAVVEKLFSKDICALRENRTSGVADAKSKLKASIDAEFNMSIEV